jgi:hypothetical protein
MQKIQKVRRMDVDLVEEISSSVAASEPDAQRASYASETASAEMASAINFAGDRWRAAGLEIWLFSFAAAFFTAG